MVHKRPFPDEESLEFPCKHSKQWECTNHLAPIMDINPSNDTHQKPQTSDNEEDTLSKCQDQQGSEFQLVTEISNGTDKEFHIGASGCISQYFWDNESAAETDADLESAFHLSFFPEYFVPGHHLKSLLQSDEIYSSPIDCPPQKPVSIGPEHQADIPEWGLKGSNNPSDTLDRSDHQVGFSHLSDSAPAVDDDDDRDKWMGTCVLSMPDSEAFASSCSERWETRNECECHDRGSVRCVRQHVRKAREELRENLGQKLFKELGFCDMGEEVSERWTEEEEQAFRGVVFANPASKGKNFWDHLSLAFPSRTEKDLVSYYFNVFMLRKRADQNRFEPLDIDSDDDEWQVSEHGGRVIEEDEDSGVESFTNQDVPPYYQEDLAEDSHNGIEGEYGIDDCRDGASVVCTVATDEEDERGVHELSVPHVRNSFDDSGGENDLQFFRKIQSNVREEDDIQDDSCTSYEYEQANCHAPVSRGTDGKQSCQDEVLAVYKIAAGLNRTDSEPCK